MSEENKVTATKTRKRSTVTSSKVIQKKVDLKIKDIREMLKNAPINPSDEMVELINVSFIADEDYILREPNRDYIERELEWYKSQSLKVDDIPGETPTIWNQVSDNDGRINSNYGWCIYSANNGYQYSSALSHLIDDKNTRKAIMIYTRPSMQKDWNWNGMSDFMCTNNVQVFIRNNKLIYIVNQRSCDAVFGYPNDLAWHQHVYSQLIGDLKHKYAELKKSPIEYICGSLHVYPRHQNLLNKGE